MSSVYLNLLQRNVILTEKNRYRSSEEAIIRIPGSSAPKYNSLFAFEFEISRRLSITTPPLLRHNEAGQ